MMLGIARDEGRAATWLHYMYREANRELHLV